MKFIKVSNVAICSTIIYDIEEWHKTLNEKHLLLHKFTKLYILMV